MHAAKMGRGLAVAVAGLPYNKAHMGLGLF